MPKNSNEIFINHLYKNHREQILNLFSDTEFRSVETIHKMYSEKYSKDKNFEDLTLEQVRYIIYILSYQQDFIVNKKSFKLNKAKRLRLDYQEIINLFVEGDLTIKESYDLYKKRNGLNNVPKISFSNALRYLCQKGCLKEVGEKYKPKFSYVSNSFINLKLERSVDSNTLTSCVNNKKMTLEETCQALGTTRGKLIGSLKRSGIKWTSRKKKKVRDTKTGKVWETLSACAKELGVSRQHVNQSMKRNAPVKGRYLEFFEETTN